MEREEREIGLPQEEVRARPARIVLDPALADGLMGLSAGDDVLVLYWLHQVTGYKLQLHPRDDSGQPLRGVFATRTQYRPNPIGATTVHVQRIEGNVLEVIGLDALDGSPVLDIKSHTPEFDGPYTV